MPSVGTASLDIVVDKHQLGRSITSGFDGAKGAFLGVAKSAAGILGGAFAATKAFDFFGDAIAGASGLAEAQSKANVVFGDFSKEISVFAKGADKIGLSDKAALDALGTFGNLFDQMGLGGKQSADMSKSLTGLAADLGSFHNADITDVIDSMTSAFRGEYDAVQKFIPTINAASVAQRALELTGKKTTKELTEQDKVLAAQKLIMEGAGAAVGDFARTSDGLANKQRILGARFEDLKSTIGNQLLPVVTTITAWFADKLPAAIAMVGPIFSKIGEVVGGFFAKVKTGGDQTGGVMEFINEKIAVFRDFAVETFPQIQEAFTHVVNVISAAWKLFGDDLLKFVSGFMERMMATIRIFLAVINGDWGKAWDAMKQFVTGTVESITGVVGAAFDGLRALVGGALGKLGEVVSKPFDGIVDFVSKLPGRITGAAAGMFDGIETAFKEALNSIIRMWNNFHIEYKGFKMPGPLPDIPGFRLDTPNIPELHTGGVVPGVPGQEVLIKAMAGETVLPTHQAGWAPVQFTGDIHLHDEIDIDMLGKRLGFAVASARGFGG